jgi:hypothetical protein
MCKADCYQVIELSNEEVLEVAGRRIYNFNYITVYNLQTYLTKKV